MTIPLFSSHFSLLTCYVSLSVLVLVVSSQCSSNHQQSLLLQLKNSLNFEPELSTKLVKWSNISDYCSWEGVSCRGGCVTHLDLADESISGGLDNSSALFSLQYIEHLNLAWNNFNFTRIPSQFKKLASLTYLNLSYAGFAGQVPIEISQLTSLVCLDLSTIYFPGYPALQLENPNLKLLIGNFSEMVELHLDGVDISAQGAQWCQAISSSLPNLKVLSLSTCNLSGPIDSSLQKLHSLSVIHLENNFFSSQVPDFISDFSNLTSLRLGYSRLNGTFPEAIFQVPTLETIDLSSNDQLQGSLPEFEKNRSLRTLVLSNTNFSGLLPDSVGELKMLSRIDLSSCNFTGGIPSSLENLTELVYLDMSNNRLNGSVPLFNKAKNLREVQLSHNDLSGQIDCIQWENLINLVNLNLGDNKLVGSIPLSLFSLPLLQRLQLHTNQFSGQLLEISNISSQLLDTLDLSSNNLEGPIPMSITKLQGLKILSLSFNNFSGSFALNDFQKLKNLSHLDLSYKSLLISYNRTSYSYSSFPNITTLALASCKLRKFPDFLRYQSQLIHLDLSANQINGEIPNWIWKLSNLKDLNLSCNSLVTLEPLSNLSSVMQMLDLHSNQLQGQIPIFSSPYMVYLDYSSNNLSSTIPTDIGNSCSYMTFFSLANNNFHGIIPRSICNASYLEVLDWSNNLLSGKIPECLSAMASGLAVLNLRRNNLIGSISDNFPGNCRLETLDLNGNQLEGKFPKSLAQCAKLVVLNLGNNQITDSFPYLLRNISSLRVLILRSNNYFGRIDCHKTNDTWPMLQIIDLANNSFSGNIPGNCLTTWRAMMVDEDASPSVLNHPEFQVMHFSELYYQDALTITSKGLEMELVKILNIYTSVDFSCNNFSGSIPKEMGGLRSLYALNLSSNSLTGEIPSSLANLKQLESLDLSKNNLRGKIPEGLAKLSFLSFLNLSYNQLAGFIPTSTQFSTLPASSFEGNKGLWGPPLTEDDRTGMPPPTNNRSHSDIGHDQIDWDFLSVEIGFVSGFGIAIGSLLFCKKWRRWYYRAMYNILVKIFPQLEQRLGNHRRHVYINPRRRS